MRTAGRAITWHAGTHARAQRGASFVLALLLVLVCVAISSALIAAATASSGRFAGQGAMDERYYAVTSAARLFRGSLGDDEQASYVFTQQRDSAGEVRLVYPTGALHEDDSAKGYDFLPVLTSYALLGGDGTSIEPAEQGQFAQPFESNWWGVNAASKEVSYTIAVPPSSGGALQGKDIDVNVRARMKDDWTLALDFSNAKGAGGAGAANAETFHLYMELAAVVNSDTYQDFDDEGDPVDIMKTTVTWRLQRVVPGRGL